MSKKDKKYLDDLRHSCAHLLAAAVTNLWPKAKPTIGPSIENGFYYDFDFGKVKISVSDLGKIEKEMKKILSSWKNFKKIKVSEKQAKDQFKNNQYKVELIDEFVKDNQNLTIYQSGKFKDLCRGGHIDNPSKELRHFKLLKIAGAYWRGDENNIMLTRIYGTAWKTREGLDGYLAQLELAKERDHRKIGRELEIFMLSSEVGPGLPLWLPKGTIIKDELEKHAKETEKKYGFERVSTPHLAKEELYIKSGHLPYYSDDMYPPMEYEGQKYYVKPMNCPHMHMIYKFKTRSYKDLPIRYAEYGTVYRHEDSGTLMGLMRVRGHTTNDAHIYCTKEQVLDELVSVLDMHIYHYNLLGIEDYYVELALPDLKKKKDKYFDNPQAWKESVSLLRESASKLKIDVVEEEGNAAFYGPKFDFIIKSVTGRKFGASTNQLDFGSGPRFNLTYVDKDGGEKIVPYVIHRAPLGSHERFIGFLIEYYGGAFPVWLSPVQVKVLPLTERNEKYANSIADKLDEENIRVEIDNRNETLQAKIRDAQIQKVPYMLIVGDKEQKSKKVALRLRNEKDLGQVTINNFIKRIEKVIDEKSLKL